MNKPKLKINEKGITLVALVITIIVLLILAGVAINMAINSDGLFGKANDAVTKWNSAVQEESDSIWDLLNIGNKEDTPEELKKGDVKLSYTVSDTSTGKQINLKIDIVDVPEIDYSSEMYESFVENEFLAGKTINEILVLGGEILYPGVGLTAEQVYDGVLKDELGKTYTEFMANPDTIIKEAYGYDTAVEFAKLYILQGFTGYYSFVIGNYAAEIMYSKQLLPELEGKEEVEIKSIVEGYYNNEKTLDQIVAEIDGATTFNEAVININEELGLTSEGGYVISREQVLRIIAANAYTATSLVVTKPDKSVEKLDWYDNTYKTITYPVTEIGDYTFTVLAPSGKTQEVTIKIGSITLDKQEITALIEYGQETTTQSLTATLNNLEESELVWTTSDENVAQIEGTGTTVNIKIKSAGTATITAICREFSATCRVINPVVTYITEGTRKAPIPVGFTASQIPTEDTISEGLVIYQGTDPVTGDVNSAAHTTAMTTRNQFVWIPVDDINYMIMCKSNSSTSVCNIALQTDGTLKCEKHNSTDLCGRVYATTSSTETVTGGTVYTYSQIFDEAQWASQTWSTSSYREPDIVNTYDKDTNTSYLTAAGVSTANQLATQLTSDFTAMATSVAKYGGFYVSRYEAGENGASLKNQKVLVAGTNTYTGYDTNTFINGNKWYGMYNTLRSSTAIDKTVVSSHMIWGSQYDMIIKFLGENSNNEPQVGHVARQLATQELTGETTTDIMSNIYDLEGNNSEWTAQANDTYYRVRRGGKFDNVASNSNFHPASRRYDSDPYGTNCSYASRSVLYVK